MKLLVVTQKIDKNDPILGFFHKWIEEFNKNFEKVTVICLEKGESELPESIKVLSLGKEAGESKLKYLLNFLQYIWQEKDNYDAVFVHMNQEYVLLAGDIWRLLGKKVYLWRNHAKGSFLTKWAVLLSHKVFYTSPSSFTARFKNSVQMPMGIDTEFFKPDTSVQRIPNSALFLGRISPVKKVLEFIDWVENTDYHATIAGPILPEDKEYGELVQHRVLDSGGKVEYVGPVTQEEARKLYRTHEIYANFTPVGSFDKTIIEAAACGSKLEVRNPDLKNFKVEDHSIERLFQKLAENIK